MTATKAKKYACREGSLTHRIIVIVSPSNKACNLQSSSCCTDVAVAVVSRHIFVCWRTLAPLAGYGCLVVDDGHSVVRTPISRSRSLAMDRKYTPSPMESRTDKSYQSTRIKVYSLPFESSPFRCDSSQWLQQQAAATREQAERAREAKQHHDEHTAPPEHSTSKQSQSRSIAKK